MGSRPTTRSPVFPRCPGRPEAPVPWLLGSSAQSAIWAGELGLPYAYADFINPGAGVDLVALYRERFVASRRLEHPRAIVAVWALCAEDDAQADRLAASASMLTILARRGKSAAVPPVETALGFVERRMRAMAPGTGPDKRFVVGAPRRCATSSSSSPASTASTSCSWSA